jgi:hypothetical protein
MRWAASGYVLRKTSSVDEALFRFFQKKGAEYGIKTGSFG